MDKEIRKRFLEGINRFNEGNFYECHDILEDVWFDVRSENRRFYQGLIHLAVGFYHITEKQNPDGALLQLKKGVQKLTPYLPGYEGIDLKNLLKGIQNCIQQIEKLKDGKVERFDVGKIPKIHVSLRQSK
jgi:predicted metal-dependent hydrolase